MKKVSRRGFVKNGVMATAALALPIPETIAKKEVFVHHVYFWLKNPESAADKAQLIAGLEKLMKMKVIKMAHIGLPADTDRSVIDRSYSVSWLCFFENGDTQEEYQKHPIHLKFIEECSSLWQKVVVYDSVGKKL